jgi:hypothetical protein
MFARVADFSAHVRPRLTCRAALPSSSEDYVWPVVPEEGWCIHYKRFEPADPGGVMSPEEVQDVFVDRVNAAMSKPARGKK